MDNSNSTYSLEIESCQIKSKIATIKAQSINWSDLNFQEVYKEINYQKTSQYQQS